MVWLAAPNLEGIAGVAVEGGRMDRAARLFGAADAVRSKIGTPLPPLHRAACERHGAAARAALGEEQFEQQWEQGRVLTVQEAVTFALQEVSVA
jgi:hypothetical protein